MRRGQQQRLQQGAAERIAIGVVAETAFRTYVIVFGRRAVREGDTGDTETIPDAAPVAA